MAGFPRLRISVALGCAALLGCASGMHEAYSAAHPGWKPDFPRRGVGLEESLASIFAPSEEHRLLTQVQRLRIFDLRPEPWREIALADLEQGRVRPEPDGDYVVVVRIQCSWWTRYRMAYGDAVSWYYFVDDALRAYEHTDFEQPCRRIPTIRGVPPGSKLRESMPALLEREPPEE